MKTTLLAGVSAFALILSTGFVAAQGTLVGTEALDDRIDDLSDDAAEELARGNDARRFGDQSYQQGWTGSVSASYSATSGGKDTQDFAVAGRMRYTTGPWSHLFGVALEFSETDGAKDNEEAFVVYDVSRTIDDRLYAYGIGRLEYDGLANLDLLPGETDVELDGFLGVGLGYRIVNTPNMAWRVQAGPGVRYIEDTAGSDDTEGAVLASSRFYYGLTDTISITNDTDILKSDFNTASSNDIGVSFAMSDNLSTRLGYRVEYDSAVTTGKKTDNTFNASLVYRFD